MDDGGFTSVSSMSGYIDIDLMDQLFDGGCWLQTVDGSKFLQPGSSTSSAMSFSSYSFLPPGTSSTNLASVPRQDAHEQESQRWELGSTTAHQKAENNLVPRSYGSQALSQNLSWKGSDQNSIWIAPKANPGPSSSVRERLMGAIYHFQTLTTDRSVLIQIWVPVRRGLRNFLTTVEQPYSYDPNCSSLASFRNVSESYQFSADEDSKEGLGLPGRVFLGKAPEWTPDVRFFRQDEYPRVNYAQMCDVRGSIALPVFEKESGSCLGVVEIVTTIQKITYRPEVETVCKALEAVDLRSSKILSPSKEKGGSEPHSAELSEILHIIRTICDKHGLPLGQTWASCTQQSQGRIRHSEKDTHCASTVGSACYVRDQKVFGFYEACSEQQLSRGQGVVGKAFMTNQPCYAIDVTAYSKAEYPLSHHAKMFGLRGAVAIHLQCLYGACKSYVLEFFLPIDCQDPCLTLHCKIMDSLNKMVQDSHSFCFFPPKEIQQETAFSGKKLSFSSDGKLGGEDDATMESSLSKKSNHKETSWISNLVEAHKRGKEVALSFEFSKEPTEEFKVTTNWSGTKADSQRGQIFTECGDTSQEFQDTSLMESLAGSSLGSDYSFGTRKAGEKKRTKAQKTISLEVLRQYFAGSLKDAAKSIGVCPTTLKRICRQHGITRWPSRKIKKVGHSLRKLQLVIDSVQGAQGSIKLSSFYSDFPQLSPTAAKMTDQSIQLNALPEITIFSSGGTSSQSTSSSQTSSSSHSFSTGAKASPITSNVCGSGDTSTSQDPVALLKRARSEAELHLLNHKSQPILERSQSNKTLSEHPQVENLPPLPKSIQNWARKDGAICKVKATFGEEMIRLTLTPNMGFGDLQCEIGKRFSIGDVNKMHIKYLDDDKEWVLLTCDDDLEECIDIQRSSGSHYVKLSVHQVKAGLGGSFGSRCQS